MSDSNKYTLLTKNIWFPDQKEPNYDPNDPEVMGTFTAYWTEEKRRMKEGKEERTWAPIMHEKSLLRVRSGRNDSSSICQTQAFFQLKRRNADRHRLGSRRQLFSPPLFE